MNPLDLSSAKLQAHWVHEALTVATGADTGSGLQSNHLDSAHTHFSALAKTLGYRVEPITTADTSKTDTALLGAQLAGVEEQRT